MKHNVSKVINLLQQKVDIKRNIRLAKKMGEADKLLSLNEQLKKIENKLRKKPLDKEV
jgi:hypothetical protein